MSATLSTIDELTSKIRDLKGVVSAKDREIEKLLLLLHQLQKSQFGRKSEKRPSSESPDQVGLFSFEAPPEDAEPDSLEVSAHKRLLKRGRKPLPADLPRVEIFHKPEETHCPCCSEELVLFEGDRTEELEYVPARLVVNEHVMMKGACPRCKYGVEQATLPDEVKPLERRRPGPGLLAHIIVSKHVDHLPLYRQEEMFRRKGVELARQRMSDWIGVVSDTVLFPLWKALKADALSVSYLQGDETSVRVQDPELSGKCHTGYFWVVHAPPEKIAFFQYDESRAGASARDVFSGFRGVLQTDLYAGYNAVLLPDEVTRIACLAHVRRKFIEVEATARPECTAVLQGIAKLYELERKWGDLSPDERLLAREKYSVPALEKLHSKLLEIRDRTLPRAPLMKALTYALSQWEEIERIFSSGSYHLDNNGVERQIRPVAIGRKNWLFAGSHDGAARAAVIYSFAATAKLNKVNFFDWLKDVICRVGSHPQSKIHELLPHRWKKLEKTKS